MVEGARLESVYAGNRIWGSNPHLSASFEFESADLAVFLFIMFMVKCSQ